MKKLLFLVLALASSLTLAAQTTLTGRVVATPNTEWTPAYVYYDLSEVATTLGYADAAALAADLKAAFVGEAHSIEIANIDNSDTESTTYTANYNRWINDGWTNVTFGCFWLNNNSEVVAYGDGNVFWSQVDCSTESGKLIIGLGQMAYQNNNTGCAPGKYTAKTKLTNGSSSVILESTLKVALPVQSEYAGMVVAPSAPWNTYDVSYSLSTIADALGYDDAAALKTEFDAKEVTITALATDGTPSSTPTSYYTRGGVEGYNYGCFWLNANGRIVSGWNADGVAVAHHFDYDETNIIIHLLQNSAENTPAGVYTAPITLTHEENKVTLKSTLVINETDVNKLTIVQEGTVYVQDVPWTDWSDKNWYSMNASTFLTETGADATFLSTNLSKLLYSYADASTNTLNNDEATNTTTAIGFWLKGATGVITPWGDGPEFYIDDVYFNADGTFGGSLGEMPNSLSVGTHREAALFIVYGTQAVKMNVVFDVVSYKIANDNAVAPATGNNLSIALTGRKLVAGWNTMVLPFDVTASQMETVTGTTVELATLTSATAESIQFTKVDQVAANTPFLVNVSADTDHLVFTGVNVATVETTPTATQGAYDFVGSYTTTTAPSGSYVLTTNNTFKLVGSNGKAVNACRAYLKANGSSSVKANSLAVEFLDSETAVQTIGQQNSSNAIYNLAGQRLSQPHKGVNIINGKKVIIK